MPATPPDPFAIQHDSTTDPDTQAPVDAHTLHLREENRALRELLAAQVQAALPPQAGPGLLRRLAWALISAPGAALVGWRRLLGRDEARPITGKRVGCATLTVLYTLAIYGALVLLVVSWSYPNAARTGATAAGPVRVPLDPLPPDLGTKPSPSEEEAAPEAAELEPESTFGTAGETAPTEPQSAAAPPIDHDAAPHSAAYVVDAPLARPRSTLRVTEIPAQNPMAWVDALKDELARCARSGFFERPDCAWAARKQFCEPNHGWGTVKECPAQP